MENRTRSHFIISAVAGAYVGLYKCHFSSKNIECRLPRWLPKFLQESGSKICNVFGPGFKNFSTGAESESENENLATSGMLV